MKLSQDIVFYQLLMNYPDHPVRFFSRKIRHKQTHYAESFKRKCEFLAGFYSFLHNRAHKIKRLLLRP